MNKMEESRIVNVNTLPATERLLLLEKLRFAEGHLYCAVCKQQTTSAKCTILPPIISTAWRADILCEQPTCMSTWMERMTTPHTEAW